jgi:hypothetical protein
MHAFYTLLFYYTHFYIIHLLSLTMHGLVTGNTLLTAAAAVAASRSKALIWSVCAISRAVLPAYWHQIRTRYYTNYHFWWTKTITNLAHPITTTTINKSIRPNRSQKLPLRNHHAITITITIYIHMSLMYNTTSQCLRKGSHNIITAAIMHHHYTY